MSDREQLAARLVEAAAKASWLGPPEWESATVQCTTAPLRREEAKRATVAVLRELSEHIYVQGREDLGATDDQLWQLRNEGADELLDSLADYIEKGAGDGS